VAGVCCAKRGEAKARARPQAKRERGGRREIM